MVRGRNGSNSAESGPAHGIRDIKHAGADQRGSNRGQRICRTLTLWVARLVLFFLH